MHHPATNAELARLAHAEALRGAYATPAPEETLPDEAPPPPAIARLAAQLLPELPLDLPWPRRVGRTPAS